jgi:hypothetical protein
VQTKASASAPPGDEAAKGGFDDLSGLAYKGVASLPTPSIPTCTNMRVSYDEMHSAILIN